MDPENREQHDQTFSIGEAPDWFVYHWRATFGNWSIPATRQYKSSVRNLNGYMDELIVIGQALEPEEVRSIFETNRP